MNTFQDLGLAFELFKAPIVHAAIDDAGECAQCNSEVEIRFDELCYDCFRRGLGDSAMDTELGMVTREFADKGMTHGLPLGDSTEFASYGTTAQPIDPKVPDGTWFHIHVSKKWLHEHLRTPRYHTWQGEQWLFCCQRPMVFRGALPADLLGDADSEADIEVAMRRFLEKPHWQDTVGDDLSSHVYNMFTCDDCGRLRHHDDCE